MRLIIPSVKQDPGKSIQKLHKSLAEIILRVRQCFEKKEPQNFLESHFELKAVK